MSILTADDLFRSSHWKKEQRKQIVQ